MRIQAGSTKIAKYPAGSGAPLSNATYTALSNTHLGTVCKISIFSADYHFMLLMQKLSKRLTLTSILAGRKYVSDN